MPDIHLPEALIELQRRVFAARLALAEHVRANGPVRDWSQETLAEGALLQQELERLEGELRQATEESGLIREHGGRTTRLALIAAASQSPRDPC
ncbi:hypothetical protein [Actinocrispum wychmicini]|uniref:hypothetical protein n=1 Tax=Actinocrispum wychmicini TaxID=1213861 RepID=UPI0010518B01|nr:hypothetical protein [Actinocrispum wychmicini]